MIKYSSSIVLIFAILFACNTVDKKMSIRYTSLNDYDAHYIFNIENTFNGLQEINTYALEEIQAQKKFVDSLKSSSYVDSVSSAYQENIKSSSFSLMAEDLYLYTPPTSFDRVSNEDIVLQYVLNENSFVIEDIVVGQSYTPSSFTIKETKNETQSSLQVNTEEFTLEVLSQVLEKIKKVGHHHQENRYTYYIKDINDTHILDVIYKDKGTSLVLNYK